MQWTKSAWNVNHSDEIWKFSAASELHFLITSEIIFRKTTNDWHIILKQGGMPKIIIYDNN